MAAASSPTPDALARLTPFGERGGLAAIVAGLTLSFVALAYFLVYWRNADMDMIVAYNAMLLNDGKPQNYFDHPAYLTIALASAWLRLLHAIGLLDVSSLSMMPAAANAAAFDAAMTQAVRAGRVLAFLLGIGAVIGFAALIKRIVADRRIALLASFAFAFSGGIVIHIGRLRSELLAAAFVVAALMILIPAARRATASRPLLLGLAALFCVLGLANKVHAIMLIAALPVLLLPFGSAASESVAPWRNLRSARAVLAAFAVAAIIASLAAAPLIAEGLDALVALQTVGARFLGLPFGVMSGVILAWLIAGVIAFARIWRVSAAETLAAALAIAAGAALGLLALKIVHHPFNSVAVINPVERMLSTAMLLQPAAGAGIFGAALLSDIGATLARYTFVLGTSSRPTIFLVWLILPGIVYAWRNDDRQTALQAAALIAVAIGIDSLGMRRGLKAEYWIFTDPLIIIAGALLLERFASFRRHRLALPIALALIAIYLGLGQSGAVRTALLRSTPQPICEWDRYFLPLMPLPFCPPVTTGSR